MSDWNTPSEPREQDPPAPPEPAAPQEDAPASSVPLRFGEGGEASDSMPLPPPAASGESTTGSYESSIPVRYHEDDAASADVSDEPAVTEPPTPEPTSWLHPEPVAPVSLDEPAAPAEESPSLAANADYSPPTGPVAPMQTTPFPSQNRFEVVVFNVGDLSMDSRTGFSERLTKAGIKHTFETPDQLSVAADSAGAVETWLEDWRLRGTEQVDVPESDDVEEVIADADRDDDEIVFDLANLSIEERRHLSMRLTGAGISHIWEVATDLVVSVEDAPAIERYVAEVRNPDGFGEEEMASFEEDGDVDDEGVYSAMSNLYVAADKLMQRPGDEATAGEFYVAVDDVDGLPAPFGFDPRVWSQVQDLANKIADTLDAEGDPDTIGTDARTLRQLLVNYV